MENKLPETPQQVPVKPASRFSFHAISRTKLLIIALCIIIVGTLGFVLVSLNPKAKETLPILSFGKKTEYFAITSINPRPNSEGNDQNTPITITFNKAVRPDSLRSYFTVSPMIPGKFTQGKSPNQVVFQAKYPFGYNTSVKVIVNKGVEAISGDKLTADYSYNFFTRIEDNVVLFENNYTFSRWINLLKGDQSFKLHVGKDIDPNGTITVYKGTFDVIVSSLLYKNESYSDSNYVSQTYLEYPVDTSKMQKISESKGIKDDAKFTFTKGAGLYYVEAKSYGKVVGAMWVNVTDEGLIVRQDDQKLAIATQNTVTGQVDDSVKVLLYNLQDKPTLLAAKNIQGYDEFPIQYPQKVDLVVGQTKDSVILVPLTIPETQADIRVVNDLSSLDKIVLNTDKPTYLTKDTIRFSGVVRIDNDANYTLPASGTSIRVWVPNPKDGTDLLSKSVPVNTDGIFSGELTLPNTFSPSDTTSLTLNARVERPDTKYFTSRNYTTFDVVRTEPKASLMVTFDRQEYTKNQLLTAHVKGLNDVGNPLKNQEITYTVYARTYDESDPASRSDFGNSWGEPTAIQDKTITLDDNGQADITFDQKTETKSNAVTLVATSSDEGVSGAQTVLVHQGSIFLSFGVSRENYIDGDTSITRVYAKDLTGKPLTKFPLHYTIYNPFDDSASKGKQTVLAEGDVTTDETGFAVIKQAVKAQINTDISLSVMGKDAEGNSVTAERSLGVTSKTYPADTFYLHELRLSNLDVQTNKPSYTVGDTAQMTITSPFDQNVLITYESGRIYHHEWKNLTKGENTYSVTLTDSLAPSINIVFSYFRNGNFVVEGVPLTVNEPSKQLSITLTSDKSSYTSGDTAKLTITTKDGDGNAVPAAVMLNALDDNIFALRDNLPGGDIWWNFYSPRTIMTNFSASTVGIGTGGGCGGGSGTDIKYVPNRTGNSILWNPYLKTDDNGQLIVPVPLSAASNNVRILVTGSTTTTAVGKAATTLKVL